MTTMTTAPTTPTTLDRWAWLPRATAAVGLLVLGLTTASGPGWGAAATHAVVAFDLDRAAAAPGYGLLAAIAVRLPLGEPALRLALLAALLAACALAGVVAAGRALAPRAPTAGVAGAALLLLAPPWRDAAATAGPAMLAAAGLTWVLAGTLAFRRSAAVRPALRALLGCLALLGAAPVAGLVATALVSAALWRAGVSRRILLGAVALIAVVTAASWIGVVGALPTVAPDLGRALAGGARGAAAVVVGAGLLGAGFGALTGLPGARTLAVALALTLADGALVAGDGAAPDVWLLTLLAIGVAVIPAAIVQIVGDAVSPGTPSARVALGAAAPLVLAAALIGPALGPPDDDPGDASSRLAEDLIGDLPPGPGVFVATREASAGALLYARVIAGLRPDLAVAPLPATRVGEQLAVDALRGHRTVGADVPSFGRLDLLRARPRGRGFELGPARFVADLTIPPPPPADYGPGEGAAQAALLALDRARAEAAQGHLDRAARAAGLVGEGQRFAAADLAVLATTAPASARPAMAGFAPHLTPPGPWLLALFGDDLAWVAGLPEAALPADAPPERRLHARWRAMWRDPAHAPPASVVDLGVEASRATAQLLLDTGRRADAEAVARAAIGRGDDAGLLLILGTVLAERGGVGGSGAPDRDVLTEALRYLERAVALAPTRADPLLWRGLCQVGLGDPAAAQASWQLADRLEPGREDLRGLIEAAR
jgi:hypothetical protein